MAAMREKKLKEEEEKMMLPSPGYRFVPTDQELLRYYLGPKVGKRSLPRWNVIRDRDLYGEEEPWEMFQGKSGVNEMYFFTQIKKKYQNGKNIDRVIMGKGAWKAQGTKEVYDDDDRLLKSGKKKSLMGFKTTLNFVSTKLPANKNTKNASWIMHEYTLFTQDEHRIALCRIKRGRGNTTTATPPSFLIRMDDDDYEEDEDNKLAATAALYKMSATPLEKQEKSRGHCGETHRVEVQQLSDETGSDDSSSKEASDSYDDSELLSNYVGSPKRYKRRTNDIVKNNLAAKSSNVLTTKDDSSIAGPSMIRESLGPNSVAEPTFDMVSVDYNQDIVSKGDQTLKSSKVSLPPLGNDAHNVKGAAPPDDLVQVIADSYDRIQLAGINFSSKYHSLEKQCQNLQGRCAELESELSKMKKELSDKDSVISEKEWENKTLHVVLRNEKTGYKRKLEGIQADSEKMIDSLKVQLHKAKKTKYSKLSDLSPQPLPIDNAPRRSP